ncbi:MAG: C10 family peptidase, partial [bacterium]
MANYVFLPCVICIMLFLCAIPGHGEAQNIYVPGTSLLTTQWHQKAPYNKFMPHIEGKPAPAGCVSVALAQIMRYYHYPLSGKGVVSYRWNDRTIKAVLYRNYHWENMPDHIDSGTAEYKIDEIARLLRDVALAQSTNFGAERSTGIVDIASFIKHFGYSSKIRVMDTTDEELFFSTIKAEIDAERPVLLQFSGHIAVADGYSPHLSGREIHINFGWPQDDNGYYFLDQNIVTTNHVYSPHTIKLYYNIRPCQTNDCYRCLEAGDSIKYPPIYGKFHSQYDTDEYRIYLKGPTSVRGTRYPYSNQGFYLSLYDSHNNFLIIDDTPFSCNLAADLYTLKVSLIFDLKRYTYDEKQAQYTVSITTEDVTA